MRGREGGAAQNVAYACVCVCVSGMHGPRAPPAQAHTHVHHAGLRPRCCATCCRQQAGVGTPSTRHALTSTVVAAGQPQKVRTQATDDWFAGPASGVTVALDCKVRGTAAAAACALLLPAAGALVAEEGPVPGSEARTCIVSTSNTSVVAGTSAERPLDERACRLFFGWAAKRSPPRRCRRGEREVLPWGLPRPWPATLILSPEYRL